MKSNRALTPNYPRGLSRGIPDVKYELSKPQGDINQLHHFMILNSS